MKKEKRILIIDDEPDMCWALERILKDNGFLSAITGSGSEALAILETNSYHFKMAFIDAKLPDMEGLELAKLIQEKDPSIVLVMISGYFYKDGDEVQQAMREGTILAFFSKPFNNEDIVTILSTFQL